ncbi:hypothetical protein PAXINDRAFT_103208 [Paxillus involutus ATCC 200175]|uniref:Uncharacterized protein n=1 Tax=Paxillus involutus ATCC 200175 TaxID=664439 RepID=A0A0C9THN2_PAXIN|nr:hypothetical protein PAXINDRAFT_103208 [Paxillus involutus ATCC 200175]
MSLNTTERRTRASNATRHPGAIVLEAQVKRCTKAEIAADNEAQRQAQATSDTISKAVLGRIATLEAEMEAKQTQVLSSKPSAIRPKPKACTHTKSQAGDTVPEAVEGDAEGASAEGPVAVEDPVVGADVEEFDEDASEDGEGDSAMQRRVSRRPVKSSFREKVKEAHRMLDQPSSNRHEDKKMTPARRNQTASKGNLLTTKASLTGLVRNWASAVVPSSSSKGPGTPARTPTNSNTALSGFKAQSATTHTSGALIPLTPGNSVVLDTSGICIGLGEGDDEIYECPVGTKGNVNLKGEDARKRLLSITDEDDNIMLPLSHGEEFELDPAMGIDSDIEIVDADSGIDEACTHNAPPKFKKSIGRSIRTTDSATNFDIIGMSTGQPMSAHIDFSAIDPWADIGYSAYYPWAHFAFGDQLIGALGEN